MLSLILNLYFSLSYLGGGPDPVVRLHCDEFAGVVLPDGHLAGGGPVPAAHLQHGVRGLDDFPHGLHCEELNYTEGRVEILCEEVAQLVGDISW